jgi:hypothetical protein
MKVHWFSVLSVVGVILLAGNSFSGELQWKKPGNSEAAVPAVTHIPSIISTDDDVEPSEVLQVRHDEAVQTPRMAPFVTPTTTDRVQVQPPQLPREKPPVPCPDLGLKSIREISHDIRPTTTEELPEECSLSYEDYQGRHFGQTCYQWKASALSTKGAYFEDVQLERYGHTKICPALQPIVSGARFFTTIAILPYKMGVTPPKECVYTLGHYGAGDCAPYMVEPFPLSLRGAAFQAGAVTGAALALP